MRIQALAFTAGGGGTGSSSIATGGGVLFGTGPVWATARPSDRVRPAASRPARRAGDFIGTGLRAGRAAVERMRMDILDARTPRANPRGDSIVHALRRGEA